MGVSVFITECVELEQIPVVGVNKIGLTWKVSIDELEESHGLRYFKGEIEPFGGKVIRYYDNR